MKITLYPMRSDVKLDVSRQGEALIVNGTAYDFSEISEGDTMSEEDFETLGCTWIVGPVFRQDGAVHLGLILPHGESASDEVLFPASLEPQDGNILLPS